MREENSTHWPVVNLSNDLREAEIEWRRVGRTAIEIQARWKKADVRSIEVKSLTACFILKLALLIQKTDPLSS